MTGDIFLNLKIYGGKNGTEKYMAELHSGPEEGT